MKALSLHSQWAMKILLSEKTIECRSWKTSYRGDLLICSSASKKAGTISGYALCVVTLDGVIPFEEHHMAPACLDGYDYEDGWYAWVLSNLRWIEPFENKGRLSLYDVDDDKITFLPDGSTLDVHVFEDKFLPLVYWGKTKPYELFPIEKPRKDD